MDVMVIVAIVYFSALLIQLIDQIVSIYVFVSKFGPNNKKQEFFLQNDDISQQKQLYYQYTDIYKEQINNKIEEAIKNDICQDSGWTQILNKMKDSTIKLLEDKPKIPLIINQQKSIDLTREQVFGFLSLMYFDLTISQEDHQNKRSFNPFCNMVNLRDQGSKLSQEKFKCIQTYFKIYYQNKDQQKFLDQKTRISKFKLNKKIEYKEWINSEEPLAEIEFINSSMFDYKEKTLVDFADPYIGGFVMDSQNCAQEEILMLLHPEAIVASLFFSKMDEDEAIYFENVLRTCNFTGYEQTFQCQEISNYQLRMENIIAIDAINFYGKEKTQFQDKMIQRELNKAFVGFEGAKKSDRDIISGKWGCGIFRGDVELKLIIQIAAFSKQLHNNFNSQKPKLILSLFMDPWYKDITERIRQHMNGCKSVGQLLKQLKI